MAIPANISPAQNLPIDVIMPNFTPGSPSLATLQTLTSQFPPAWDYWDFRFLLTNISLAMISEMRVLVNNSIIVRIAGADWNTVNKIDNIPDYGSSATSGTISWFFRRVGMTGAAQAIQAAPAGQSGFILTSGSSKDQSLFTTLNCGTKDANGYGIASVNVEFDLYNTGAAAPNIQCHAHGGSPTNGGAGFVRRMEYKTPNVSAGSSYEASNNAISFGDVKHQLLNRLHFVPTSGTLDQWVVRHNGVQKLVRSSAENNYVINSAPNRTSQSANGLWSLMWDENAYGDETLPIGNPGTDLQIAFTPSATGQVRLYEDAFGSL